MERRLAFERRLGLMERDPKIWLRSSLLVQERRNAWCINNWETDFGSPK
jgi:hypothetical protein